MMRLRFGTFLDGTGSLGLPSTLGDADLGPAGLLSFLETHLGLGGAWPSAIDRSLMYHASLKQSLHQDRFFSASFSIDELGVSGELLRWRDGLHLAGWNGSSHSGYGQRIFDLAEVERHVPLELRCSVGERLQRIEVALSNRCVPLQSLKVVEPRASFPLAWRRVLDRLPASYEAEIPPSAGSSQLGQLQTALGSVLRGDVAPSLGWRDDGSLSIVRSETRLMAGRWVAGRMQVDAGSHLILAETHGELLDHLLEGAGVPRHGFAESSAFRPSLQVLPLAMALIWEPLDIYAALEFLTHTICPVPRYARERLAEQLSKRPGLQREDYSKVLADIRAHYGDAADEMVARVDAWMFTPRHLPSAGAPLDEVVARADALMLTFARRLATTDDGARPAIAAAHQQCRAVSSGLKQFLQAGGLRIGPVQLRKLITQATSFGSTNPLRFSESGCAAFSESPGAIIDPVDNVTWWHISAPSLPPTLPWTRVERRQLAEGGVELPSTTSQLSFLTRSWLRPIMAARNKLTLVLPATSEEQHPVMQLLKQIIPDLPESPLDGLLVRGAADLGLQPLAHRPLPALRRWWTLSPGTVPSRSGRASFSSLDQYLNNPSQWVLSYAARLYPSRIRSVPDEFTMSGNVSHRVVQKLFERSDALQMSAGILASWIERMLDDVIRSEAAVFLLPGMRTAERKLRNSVNRAVLNLCSHLRDAGVKAVETERWMEGRFQDQELVGSADLVLTFETGDLAVVDLKWAGAKKYPDKLVANRHVQLMVYSGLLHQDTGRWPRSAYYLLKDTQLLAHDREVFRSSKVCAPRFPETAPQLWARLEATWEWRRSLLDKGLVELALDRIDSDALSAPPADCLNLEALSEAYNPYLNLSGWTS